MSLVHTLIIAITTLISSIPLHDLEYIRTLTTKVINGVAWIQNANSHEYKQNDAFPPHQDPEVVDFVIVGAGPSGSVLANRLSEITEWNVLLLEAGGVPSFLSNIPMAHGLLYPSVYDWGTLSERQAGYGSGCLNNNRLNIGHGKGLGGGTLINFMVCTRGNKMDYDSWEVMGNPGWSYEDVLPYFLKIEDASIAVNDTGYHAKGGPVSVTDISFRTKVTDVFVNASQQAGYPYVDYNGKQQLGVSYMQATLRNGLRADAENAYLRPVRHRKNLKIRTGAHVTKILIKPESKEAYGVEYKKNGKIYRVLAQKEVILSAGGLNSPQVLMLSGIGPKSHLEEIGIPVIKDLPVGETYYDHVGFIDAPYVVNQHIDLEALPYGLDPKTYTDLILYHKGPLASIAYEALTYVKTNLTDPEHPTWPDIELMFLPATLTLDFGIFFRAMANINEEIYNSVCKPIIDKPAFTVVMTLLHPLSKGYVRLRSKNPFDQAKYTLNYFTDPENLDIKRLIVAIRETQRIANQPALKELGAKKVTAPWPGCKYFTYDSDEYWECAIRASPSSVWHQQSTCRMGPSTDKEAVVDARLRVHGIKNLRVADASIIPKPITAHTAVPCYMIGEKTADMIKEDWEVA